MLSRSPESRSQSFSHLLADQSERWRRGDLVRVEHYLGQYPELAADEKALLDLIHSEMLRRLETGERPALDEYLRRFPQQADGLRHIWELLKKDFSHLWSGSGNPNSTASEEPTADPLLQPAALPLSLPGLELLEKLDEGGMGVVFRARDRRLDRPRAVKFIRAGLFAGQAANDRFQREAKAVARLDHAGVVRIYALGEHEQTLYICMEFLEGGSLKARLSQGPLEVRTAADLVRQLALAIQHAHDNKVLHRDLKPANVLLTADGAPKVSDFGLAKLLDAEDDLTQTGVVIGTPSYMAPEQAEARSRDIGPGTDVWALGTILYECLTGRPPFKTGSRSETLELVRKQPPVPPRQLRPEVPAELEFICLKCLEKEPAKRYTTAAALAAALQEWLDGKTRPVRPTPRLRRLLGGLRRRRLLSVAAGVILLAGLCAAMFGYVFHPNRPLWQLQAQLRQGESLELIGPTEGPTWWNWWIGEKDAKAFVDKTGYFTVYGSPLTLIELLPNTAGQSHYEIHAEIRHEKIRGANSFVGVYFAGKIHRTAKVPVYSFLKVYFDDQRDVVDEYNRLSKELREQIPPPKGNNVRVGSLYYADGADKPTLFLPHTFAAPEIFRPSGYTGKTGDWRTVVIKVSPAMIRVWFNGKFVAELIPAKVEEHTNNALKNQQKQSPTNPALDGLVPGIDWQGGFGLFLQESYASFGNVRILPGAGTSDSD